VKILVVNDNSDHPNWGAQATPLALRRILNARIPGCEIRALSWAWIRMAMRSPKVWPFKQWQIRLDAIPHMVYAMGKLTRPVENYPRVSDDFDWFADQWVTGQMGEVADEFMALARWADVVVYNGENNLFRNTLEGCRSLFLVYLAKTRLGRPVCSLNHTVHITGVRPIMKAMIQKVLPTLDLVTTRELRSHRALEEMGVKNAKSGADVVFALAEEQQARERVGLWLNESGLGGKPFACVSASGLPTSRPKGEYDGTFTDLVRQLGQTLSMPIVLVARDPSLQYLEEVARRTGSRFFGPEHHLTELWPLFREASVAVTGHFHYAIIAAASGCPFVPLSVVNHKMSGLCEQLGWARTEPFDITWLEPIIDDICSEALAHVQAGDALRETLAARAVELAQLALATGDWVRESVDLSQSHPVGGRAGA